MSGGDGKATKSRSTFRLEVGVEADIRAAPAKIWALLADAPGYVRWNSTVKSVEGTIAEGGLVKLVSTSAPDRTFKLKVTGVEPEKAMTWSDGFFPMFHAARSYALTPNADGTTRFSMTEVMRGLMLPMIAGSLPDFVPVFEQYAADLKKAAEAS
ncbi:MAG TPA: SRPBCC domain-containing protein [Minicystis sp.]|nr:SRPBCC domain-containing protein [Minicystis sp.]